MIGVDTNVLIRYFTEDSPHQTLLARKLIEDDQRELIFVSLVTVTELVWVLRSNYGFARIQIAKILEDMLNTKGFQVQNEDEVSYATEELRQGNHDFADVLLGALGAWKDCETTYTFDAQAARLPEFRRVPGY